MEQTGCRDLRHLKEHWLIDRIFTDRARPAEELCGYFCGREGEEPPPFGVVGLYGRSWEGLEWGQLFESFGEVFSYVSLTGLILLLVRAGADCRETAEGIARWLRERGLRVNLAYLSGECRMAEARQIRAAFEAAASEMFFLGEAACLPLEALPPDQRPGELSEEALRRLRQLRQDMTACLVRGEADYVREKLEEYFRVSAQSSPALFREQCAGLYFRVDEELAAPGERRGAYRGRLCRRGKSVFQLVEEAGSASEIREHVSWYMEQLLAWYRPLRKDTSSRVAALVEEYIGDHYMDPIAMEDIAACVGLSANYVRSVFKSSRGKTIQRYLLEYRLEMACLLLRDTPNTVGRVGQMVGYNNVSYFCASFQKQYGKTPSEWRRALQAPRRPGGG